MPFSSTIALASTRGFVRPRVLATLLLLAAPLVASEGGVDDPVLRTVSVAEKLVQEQVDAYNRHDLEAFLKTYAPEVTLYDFPDKVLSTGLEAMRERYGKLFQNQPDLKVRISNRIVQGDCVIDHEEVTLGGRQFRAVAIYRVKGGKITAVWFVK